jgi:gamma-glutamylcyclotransferase (GGCT)/AIG2-like uncharacterized protein YtfP
MNTYYYPKDFVNCEVPEVLDGNLNIYENSSLKNLDELKNLKEIRGYLYISENSSLQNLDGLKNLKEIEGDLYIYKNSSLQNLDGLKNLKEVKGYLDIYDNHSLQNLDGLKNLKEIKEYLNIYNNKYSSYGYHFQVKNGFVYNKENKMIGQVLEQKKTKILEHIRFFIFKDKKIYEDVEELDS